MFPKELDGIAGFAAAEAFESSPCRVDYKTGSFFIMERAAAGIVDPFLLRERKSPSISVICIAFLISSVFTIILMSPVF